MKTSWNKLLADDPFILYDTKYQPGTRQAEPTENPNMLPTSCQICGRTIKAKQGLIAHHGYTRPGMGFQTPSCYGARRLPYEHTQGYDAILGAIAGLTDWAATLVARADAHEGGIGTIMEYKAYNHAGTKRWQPFGTAALANRFAPLTPEAKAAWLTQRIAAHGGESKLRAAFAQHLRQVAGETLASLPALRARYTNHPTIKAGTL